MIEYRAKSFCLDYFSFAFVSLVSQVSGTCFQKTNVILTLIACKLSCQEIADGVSNIEGLSLVGEPTSMMVCFRGEKGVNIYKVVRTTDPIGHDVGGLIK